MIAPVATWRIKPQNRPAVAVGVFCKKGDLSSTQGALLCTVSVFFYFTFLFILGVRTHQRTPPQSLKNRAWTHLIVVCLCLEDNFCSRRFDDYCEKT